MSSVCFGEYAKRIKNPPQTDEALVYDLLNGIIKPLRLKNKNGQEYLFEKKEISGYMTLKLELPQNIKQSAKNATVKSGIAKYFNDKILLNQSIDRVKLLDKIFALVKNDVSILPAKKTELLTLASDETLAEFLGSVFLFAVTSRNDYNKKVKSKTELLVAPRISDSENYLLFEVGGNCPTCGRTLIISRGNIAVPDYEMVDIYLLNATPQQTNILRTIPLPTYSLDDVQNRIAMCSTCKSEYLSAFSIESYNTLVAIKNQCALNYQAQLQIEKIEIEDLKTVVKSLAEKSKQNKLGVPLSKNALRVANKLPTELFLRQKIEGYVITCFNDIKELFKQEETTSSFNFDTLAEEIKLCFMKLDKKGFSQPEIFDKMTTWIQKQTPKSDKVCCEAIVSFFVQNCEVFREVS